MQQIDTQTYNRWSGETCKRTRYYIYKDKNSKMIVINYESKKYLKDYDFDHLVTIYYDVSINESFNVLNSEEVKCGSIDFYSYQDGQITDSNKYEFGDKKEYEITMKDGWFSNHYILEEKEAI